MSDENVAIAKWTQMSSDMLKKVTDALNKVGYKTNELPSTVFDKEKPITMVFVGQFSAGKSSIIKALTGIEDIEIGEGIKTMSTQCYRWMDGIEVIDTPGIHTKLRPDHDEISYKAIADADLLAFVITEDLFEPLISENFRKLLLEQDKASEMILIVNKMADIGNTEENRQVKLDCLRTTTEPYSPEDLRTVFIDAKSFLRMKELSKTNPDIAAKLKKRSNFDQFIEVLNNFTTEKGLSSRLTTVLYRLIEILQEAITRCQSSTGDEDIDDIEEHLRRERYIILQKSWRLETAVKSIYESAASDIRDKGRTVASEIFDCKDEESAEAMLDQAYGEVNTISADCEKNVIAKIEEIGEECQAELDEFYDSDFSNALRISLNKRGDSGNPIIEQFLRSEWIAKGSSKIISNTAGTNAAATGLKAFSGSKVHEWILNIGHYFGHNFKPWEAVKWVKRVNVAGKALGIFGVALSWGLQARDDYNEDKRNREIKENREKIRAGFNDAANTLTMHYVKAMNDYLDANYRQRITKIDEELLKIRALQKDKSDACKLLESTQNECRELISEIHRETISPPVAL